MSRRARRSPVLVLLLLLLPAVASAQSAGEVLQQALERYEERMEGVENYTVVQTAMGFDATTHFERRTVDGHVVFVQAEEASGSAARQIPQSYSAMLEAMRERAAYGGTESVDGNECHVLTLDDFSGERMESLMPSGPEDDWTPKRMKIWLDSGQLVPRKMLMEGTVTGDDGREKPVTFTARMKDYREVEGVLHPFRMEMSSEGLGEAIPEEDRAEIQRSLEQMKAQMENMSPQQREMMKQMMGGQMEQLEEMLASGSLDFTVEVTELRVNEGPPGAGG
jgi:hypothetical protein